MKISLMKLKLTKSKACLRKRHLNYKKVMHCLIKFLNMSIKNLKRVLNKYLVTNNSQQLQNKNFMKSLF